MTLEVGGKFLAYKSKKNIYNIIDLYTKFSPVVIIIFEDGCRFDSMVNSLDPPSVGYKLLRGWGIKYKELESGCLN